jgi:hypothetical protein
MGDPFIYLSERQVLLFTSCGYCRPGRDVWIRHLRQQPPHCLKGAPLKAIWQLRPAGGRHRASAAADQGYPGAKAPRWLPAPDLLSPPNEGLQVDTASRVESPLAEASAA